MIKQRVPKMAGRRRLLVKWAVVGVTFSLVGGSTFVSLALAGRFSTHRPREIAIESLDPGDPKREAILQEEARIERLRRQAPPPEAGPPAEMWDPEVAAGIDDSGESPYPQRRGLVIVNAWHSGLSPAGKLTHLYAATEDGHGLVIFAVTDLLSGLEESHHEYALPGDAGTPRIVVAASGFVNIETSRGLRLSFDLAEGTLVPE